MPRLYEGYAKTAWLVTQFDLLAEGWGMFGLARTLAQPQTGKVGGLRAACHRTARVVFR